MPRPAIASVVSTSTPARTRARSDTGSHADRQVRWRRSAPQGRPLSGLTEGRETEAEPKHLRRDPQAVPDAADRVDQRRLDAVELLAQVGDVRLDHVGVATEVVLPHVVE